MLRFSRRLLVIVAFALLATACGAQESDSLATGTTEVPDELTPVAPAPTDEVTSAEPTDVESVEDEPAATTTVAPEEASTTTTETTTTTSTTTTSTTATTSTCLLYTSPSPRD